MMNGRNRKRRFRPEPVPAPHGQSKPVSFTEGSASLPPYDPCGKQGFRAEPVKRHKKISPIHRYEVVYHTHGGKSRKKLRFCAQSFFAHRDMDFACPPWYDRECPRRQGGGNGTFLSNCNADTTQMHHVCGRQSEKGRVL